MNIASKPPKKAYKSVAMEGMIASWYAKNTGQNLAEFERDAERIAARLKPGARILEVAPGPGYLSIALARQGFGVTGLDISRSFVRIAAENAGAAGVDATFRHGNAADIPYPDNSFDFIVCRAAFKNFADPVGALREMRRVAKPGAETLIIDMSNVATDKAIAEIVDGMGLGAVDALVTRITLRGLRNRAYSRADFERMATEAGFTSIEINAASIGFDVWLRT